MMPIQIVTRVTARIPNLRPSMHTCPQCQGRGVIDAENGENYQICPTCKMTQYVFDGSPEERKALMEQIKSEYPDAAVVSRATVVYRD